MRVTGTRSRWRAAIVASLLLCAACGSTVSQAQRRQAAAGARAGVDAGQAAGGQLDTGSGGGTGTGGTTDNGGSSVGGGVGGATSRSGSSSQPGSTAVGPGVTTTTINIGLSYSVNSAAANAAIGGAGISQGDAKTEQQILIDDINAHGGVLGRKLVPVYHQIDLTSTGTNDELLQQECADWTADHKVFAAEGAGFDSILQCLEKAGVAAFSDGGLTLSDGALFKRYPNYVEITTLNLDRIAATEVPALNAQHYFTGWDTANGKAGSAAVKVGVLTYDTPSFGHAVDNVLVPLLKASGHDPGGDVVKVLYAQRTSDDGATAAAVSSAVLKFRTDGVSHVLILDASGLLDLLFLSNANSQHYTPRYGVNSQNGLQALSDAGDLPKQQLVGATGIGWQTALDITPSQNQDNGPYSNDARKRCLKLYSDHGITFPDPNSKAVGLGYCNELWFFRDAANLGGAPNRAAFFNGVSRLNFAEDVDIFPVKFSATQHDGMNAVHYWSWDAGCGCMKYSGGLVAAAPQPSG